MEITIDIPEEFSDRILPAGQDRGRAVLEAMVGEAYREGRLATSDLRSLLGFQSRDELDGFLKRRNIRIEYTLEDMDADRAAMERSLKKGEAALQKRSA